MKKEYPEDDAEVTDPFESREFYELCQAYRHSGHLSPQETISRFEAVKEFARKAKEWGKENDG